MTFQQNLFLSSVARQILFSTNLIRDKISGHSKPMT